ncbi:MAG: FAD-dependent oxidoreductase [Armatimonadetes bacterium]|nr:FAD-dependent oxidoreductase [Armatimonadota bacterium]
MVDFTDRYYATIPDYDYWKQQIKCQYACPVHTDARGYIRAVADGDYEAAYLIARGPNPLASICGRVCGAPCQAACRRGSVDAPLNIRALKRVVMDLVRPGMDHKINADFPEQGAQIDAAGPCLDSNELYHLLEYLKASDISKPSGEHMAIIGSGPAGLAAAHDLALLGLRPTIFEMEPVPAGMLYVGVPEYRLPRDLIRAEVAVIEALGVDIRCNVQVGKDISLAELRRDFAAVIIAVGAKLSRKIDIPGVDAEGVIGGIDFLRDAALGQPPKLGERVVVIGGGNVAYDVSRTALRQEESDVSRTALRQPSVREVHLCCLESLEEMPADEVEIIEGDEEGIVRRNRLGPKEILFEIKDDRKVVKGIVMRRCLSVFDENRRFAPKFDENDLVIIPADTVLLAVGQATDLSFVNTEEDGVELNERGQLKVDLDTLATSAPGVFAAGDIAYGTKLIIDAIASGKKAALSVYEYITGKKVTPEQAQMHYPIENYEREPGYELIDRVPVPTTDIGERVRSYTKPVESGYSLEAAWKEASRCLDCGVNTIFDGDKCILCGGCADVCPMLCLKIIPVGWLAPSPDVEAAIESRYRDDEEGSAIIKDETLCIRCGLCAERCPTNAITMERFQFAEAWREARP